MNDREALRKRVDDIGAKIDEALERLRLQHALYSEHGPTGEDLKKRYELIKGKVDDEVADIEAQGHHVSALERSALEWLEHLNFDK